MYVDGLFDQSRPMVHPPEQLPDDVMVLDVQSDLDKFLFSKKDIALYEIEYPLDYQTKVEDWAVRLTIEETKLSGLSQLSQSISSEGMELIDPFWGLVQHLAGHAKGNVQVALKTIREQMCPLFHVDNVYLRFIVTLRGPGTLWLQDKDVFRKNLGKGGKKPIVKPNSYLQQVRTGQVAILKGRRFPNSQGLVHKSPAVDPQDGYRVMIRFDFK